MWEPNLHKEEFSIKLGGQEGVFFSGQSLFGEVYIKPDSRDITAISFSLVGRGKDRFDSKE